MKPSHAFYFTAGLLAAGMLTACAPVQKASQPEKPLNSNVRPAPEVVRYDRYLLIDTSPQAAQRAPLEQMIDIRIPSSFSPTVADALRYVLRTSGYALCGTTSANRVLYMQPLPAVHYHLGPMRLSQALQILAGPAWQVEVDDVQRIVCHSLREGYRQPAEPAVLPAHPAPQRFLVTPPAINAKPVAIKHTAPFLLTGIERRGGMVFAAIAPLYTSSLSDVALMTVGESRQGWTLLSAAGQQAQFSVAGTTRTLSVK